MILFRDTLGGRGTIAEELEGGDDATTDATEDDLLYKLEEQGGTYVPVVVEKKRCIPLFHSFFFCYFCLFFIVILFLFLFVFLSYFYSLFLIHFYLFYLFFM